MDALTAESLLDVWESGLGRSLTERALSLLAVASPGEPSSGLAALSIGRRDARLIALRQHLWGPRMTAIVRCPGCRESLELDLDTRELLRGQPPNQQPQEVALRIEQFTLTLRLPNSLDVMAATVQPNDAAAAILDRCLLSASSGGEAIETGSLPPEVMLEIAQAMAEADPLAEIRLGASCSHCSHRWDTVFDIVSFLWKELENQAVRILNEVHLLAQGYGWSERDILRMGGLRRQCYLERLQA